MERAPRRGIRGCERGKLWMEFFLRATLLVGKRIGLQWGHMSLPDVKNANRREAEVLGGGLAVVSLRMGARSVF
jgi:hypothetical protein